MIITYLEFMQKWLVSYKGKAIGVGDTVDEALGQALATMNPDKFVWDRNK